MRPMTDDIHTNPNYPSVDEMKEMMKKGIGLELYSQRLRHGWDKEKAQNTIPRNKYAQNNYKQFSEFELEHMIYNYISYMDYTNRRRLGWSREEAIFIPKGIKRYQFLKHDDYPLTRDELKEIYQNETTVDTYRARRVMGWSKESAMKTPKRYKKHEFKKMKLDL